MIRVVWTRVPDNQLLATRRGMVARITTLFDAVGRPYRWHWSVKQPTGFMVKQGHAKSEDSAKRRARNVLAKCTPEIETKEQLAISGAA